MATAADYASTGFSRSSSLSINRSPDTASSVYPERAIRPLPRKGPKSRLSPEQASSIVYPPDPPPISPASPFTPQENGSISQQPRLMNGDSHHHHHHHHNHEVDHHAVSKCTCDEMDSGEEDIEFDHPEYRYPNGLPVKPVDAVQRRLVEASRGSMKPAPPGSTASSGDGYESFENTSNKKKRKIPLSGAPNMHQSQLSAEMANMGINEDQLDGSGEAISENGRRSTHSALANNAQAVGAGTGISGAGRGRYGRQDGKHRRPLGSSTMNTINGYTSRASPRGGDVRNGADNGIENTGGIISQAIKTAAEQGPLTPSGKGRENGSLLQSATSINGGSNATPNTQFTFTCESDSATKLVDQQQVNYPVSTPTPSRGAPPIAKSNMQGTQTTPHRGNPPANHASRPPPPPSGAPPNQHQQAPAPPPPKPKPRRNPNKEYALQAANRKKHQQYQNYNHRPKQEDMWVCEFCEYEDIFGEPPRALIRRYEIKDRQERLKAAEKRRLLEKAKMKGRKNKKGSGKGGKNNNNAANNAAALSPTPANSQHHDPNLPPPDGDEYYDDEDEYADEYEPVGPDEQYPQDYYPPPVPAEVPYGHGHGPGGGART